MIRIGVIQQIVRYPVKSMRGTPVASAELGWHGLAGDRRFAFRRVADGTDFPWLTASRLPELLLYSPVCLDSETAPSHVRTPSGEELELRGEPLRQEISDRAGYDVELMNLRNGIFDDAAVSVINAATIRDICSAAGVRNDARRFRANIVVQNGDLGGFEEEGWLGGTLFFGGESGAQIAVSAGDVRCMMINLDPDTSRQEPAMMKYVVRRNNNVAGVYAATIRGGALHAGDDVFFRPARTQAPDRSATTT